MRLGAVVVIGGLAIFAGPPLLHHLMAAPQWAGQAVVPSGRDYTGRRVIASAKTDNERCDVPGVVNGQSLTLEIDTGDPNSIDLPSKFVARLGLKPGSYEEFWPGTRYGKIAKATVREIRVGDVVWLNQQGFVYSDWDYTFGSDEIPLLGLAALRAQGVHVEFDGGMCHLTVAQSSAPMRFRGARRTRAGRSAR